MTYPRLEMDAEGIVSLITLPDPDGDPVTERLGRGLAVAQRVPFGLLGKWSELYHEWLDAGRVGDDIRAETERAWRERL